MRTKDKIFEAAVAAFNEHGIANTRLQHIADECGISVGNLAYHFKNKAAIISFVYDTIFNEFSSILSDYLLEDSLLDTNQRLEQYYAFFHKYRFHHTDIFEIERNYPDIITLWHHFTNRMLLQIKARIDYDVARGIMYPQTKAATELLANNIWMSIIFWLPQRVLRGLPLNEPLFKEAVWSQITPHLTDEGRAEFDRLISPSLIR